MSESRFELNKKDANETLEQSKGTLLAGSSAGLSHQATGISDTIVSHTTSQMDHVQSILKDGVKLSSNPHNFYGGQSFYVAEKGFSIHETNKQYPYTLAFRLSKKARIYNASQESQMGHAVADMLKSMEFDAIKYEGIYVKNRIEYTKWKNEGYCNVNPVELKCSYNLAIINKPEYLKPIGIYPLPLTPNTPTAFSVPIIRGIQGLGVAGTFYAVTHAGLEIANSDQPVKEALYQGSILGVATWSGMLAGTKAIIPCGKLGALFPPAAPYTVPICIAGSSILGGILGASATEYTWEAAEDYLVKAGNSIKNDISFPSFSLTSSAMAGPILDNHVAPIKLAGQCNSIPLNYRTPVSFNHSPERRLVNEPTDDHQMSNAPGWDDNPLPRAHLDRTEQEIEGLIDRLQHDTASLVDIWAQHETDITGFEHCPHIVNQAIKLQKMREEQATTTEIKNAASALKDAKFKEHAERIHFDECLRTAEGVTNLVGAGIALCGNNKLAKKVLIGGGALVSIGKELGALAGFGSAAAVVNPWAAAGNIALSFIGLMSLGSDEGSAMEAIFENLEQIKLMIQNVREEMHARFNVIDEKLEKIYHDVCAHLADVKLHNEKIELSIERFRHENKQMHTHTHDHLKTLQYRIDALFANILEHAVIDALHAVTDPIRICINYPELPPTRERYSKWLAQFQLFMEQSSYSVFLAGDRNLYQKQLHMGRYFNATINSEAEFHVNSLIGSLEIPFPEFKQMPSQPNFTVWAYASLAIIRLIYLMNHDKQATIPRNEFNILALIKDKLQQQINFREQIKQVTIANRLVDAVQEALRHFSQELNKVLVMLNETKNQQLNESLSLYFKTRWYQDSMDISGQALNIRTDYPGWFHSWSKTHYGQDGKGKRAVVEHVTKYKEEREQRVNDLKKIPSQPVIKTQLGIVLEADSTGNQVANIHYNVSDFPHLALHPKQNDLPIFNLYTPHGYIDLMQQSNLPAVCGIAEYLGIGQLRTIYDIDVTNKKISIFAELDLKGQTYTVSRLDMSFALGVYERKEGALWGWYGDTELTLTQVGPVRYLGSTGDPNHWFKAYGKVPVLTSPDAGPMKSLAQPECQNARKGYKTGADEYQENLQKIEKMVHEHCDEIYNQYARDIKKLLFTDSALSQSLESIVGALERLEIFMMLALDDTFEHTNSCMNYLFSDQDFIPSIAAIKNIFVEDEQIGHRVLALSKKLETVAYALEDKKSSLSRLLQGLSGKANSSLFKQVCYIIDDAYKFYEHRIQETGTHHDLFKENEELKQNFEQVNSLLQILAGAMAGEVKDHETQQRILQVVQTQMQAQGLKLPGNVASQLQSTQQTPLQKLSFLSSNSSAKTPKENNTNGFKPGNQ